MISHERAQRLLSSRLDELLPPADHHALQEHLAHCPECRAFARQADALARELRGLPFLPPSPAVSRAVLAEIRRDGGGFSPLAWLGGLRFAPGPALAVASSFVLIAALAFTVSLALKPPGDRPDPSATSAAVALAPKTTPTPHPIVAPTDVPVLQLVPTTTTDIAPTRPQEAAPTATRPISIQAPPTPTPTIAVPTAPPVEQPAIVVATEPPAPPPTEAPQLAQGDTSGTMDLAQGARSGDKTGQQAEAQAADAGQPLAGAVDAGAPPVANDSLAAGASGVGGTYDAGTYDAAISPAIAPGAAPDATPPPDEGPAPTIAPHDDGQQLDAPQSQAGDAGQGTSDGTEATSAAGAEGAAVGPPTPTPLPAFPTLPNGFGDGGKMQVSLTAGQNGKPASISVIPVPPTPTPVPTATATPDPAATTTPTPASGDASADGTPAGESS